MKRLVLTLILVFTAAGFVFAQSNAGAAQQNNKGAYYNCPYPDCPLCTGGVYGPGMGKGGRAGKGMAMGEPVIVTTDQAKNAVEKYIQNLKGYYIETVESFNRAGGGITSYRVYVKDGSGNSFFYHVDPWGRVGGPIAYTRTK